MRKVSPQGTNREPETEAPGAFGDHRDVDSNVAGTRHWDKGETVAGEPVKSTATRGPSPEEKKSRAGRHHA
jgi:hypothetical protein